MIVPPMMNSFMLAELDTCARDFKNKLTYLRSLRGSEATLIIVFAAAAACGAGGRAILSSVSL